MVERITVTVNMVTVVIFLGGERPLLRFRKRFLMWLPKSWVLLALSYLFLVFFCICVLLYIFLKINVMVLPSVDCHLQHLTVALCLHRAQPYGAAI